MEEFSIIGGEGLVDSWSGQKCNIPRGHHPCIRDNGGSLNGKRSGCEYNRGWPQWLLNSSHHNFDSVGVCHGVRGSPRNDKQKCMSGFLSAPGSIICHIYTKYMLQCIRAYPWNCLCGALSLWNSHKSGSRPGLVKVTLLSDIMKHPFRPNMRNSAVNCILTAVAVCDIGTMASYLIYIVHFVLRRRNTW